MTANTKRTGRHSVSEEAQNMIAGRKPRATKAKMSKDSIDTAPEERGRVEHPLESAAGSFRDDPFWDDLLEEMRIAEESGMYDVREE